MVPSIKLRMSMALGCGQMPLAHSSTKASSKMGHTTDGVAPSGSMAKSTVGTTSKTASLALAKRRMLLATPTQAAS